MANEADFAEPSEVSDDDVLSADEQAFFDSRGEKAPEAPPSEQDKAAQAAVEGKQPDKADPQVPLRALTKEREENRRIKAEFDAVKQRQAILEDRWTQLLQANQPQQEGPPPPPNPDEDIFGALKHALEKVNGLETKLTERQTQEQQAHQAQQIETAIWNVWEDDVRGFVTQQADFPDAAKWLAEARDKQLSALGTLEPRLATKAGRDAQMNAELREMVINARRNNMSPAEAVYNVAKSWGFSGAQPPAQQEQAPGAKAVADLAKNVDAELSLTELGGASTKTLTSPDDVLSLSDDDFATWMSKNGDKGFRGLMGA